MYRSAEVRIEIIDIAGTINKSINNGTMQRGEHSLNINIGEWGLPSGSYFCRLHIGVESSAMPFIIMD